MWPLQGSWSTAPLISSLTSVDFSHICSPQKLSAAPAPVGELIVAHSSAPEPTSLYPLPWWHTQLFLANPERLKGVYDAFLKGFLFIGGYLDSRHIIFTLGGSTWEVSTMEILASWEQLWDSFWLSWLWDWTVLVWRIAASPRFGLRRRVALLQRGIKRKWSIFSRQRVSSLLS